MIISWLAVVVWAALIFYFSARPNLKISYGTWGFVLRKSAHMAEFAVLSFLVWRALKQHGVRNLQAIVIATVLAFLFAVSDEYHQSFVVGRTASATDVGFDLTGIAAVVAVAMVAGRIRQGEERPTTRR